MKKIASFFIAILLCCSVSGQPTSTDSAINQLRQQQAQLRDSLVAAIRTLNDSLNANNNIYNYIDSPALALAQKYPHKLYAHDINHPTKDDSGMFRFIAMLALLGAVWYFGLKYCFTSGMCRDASYDSNGVLRELKARPYSYARIQLFWWTMIISSCYIYFFGYTGVLVPLNPTSVILLGLGAMVLAGGKLIDQRQIQANAFGSRVQDQDSRFDSFLTDILSDDNGLSIHRFQAVVFNVVFGVGFFSGFVSAIYHLQYPFVDFSQGQFALLGISSATYLGLKMTENSTPGNTTGGIQNGNQPIQQPTQPVQPVQPIQPVQPVQPIQPVQPVQPIQPVQPVQPIQPVQPVQPVQPAQPVASTGSDGQPVTS